MCTNTPGSYQCSCYDCSYQLSSDGETCTGNYIAVTLPARELKKCTLTFTQQMWMSVLRELITVTTFVPTMKAPLSAPVIQASNCQLTAKHALVSFHISHLSCDFVYKVQKHVCWSSSYACALCADTNECNTNNGGCEQECVNTDDSFMCECTSGYVLSSDGRHCNGKTYMYIIQVECDKPHNMGEVFPDV